MAWKSESGRLAYFKRSNIKGEWTEKHEGGSRSYDAVKVDLGKIKVAFVQTRPNIGNSEMEKLLEMTIGKVDLILGDFNCRVPGLLLGK